MTERKEGSSSPPDTRLLRRGFPLSPNQSSEPSLPQVASLPKAAEKDITALIPTQALITFGRGNKQETNTSSPYPLTERVSVQTEDAFHLMIVSNVMYGSKHCDVETFEKDLNIARSLENTKILLLGTLISHRNVRTDIISPEAQVEYMRNWISLLDAENKILAGVRADYPKSPLRRENRIDDVNDVLFDNVSFPVLHNGGILKVAVEEQGKPEDNEEALEQVYTIGVFSKHGTSKTDTNKNASAKRAFLEKLGGSKVDVAIVGNPYIADVTQTIAGHVPTRENLTLITAGTYVGNTTGERPDLTDRDTRDKFAIDGEPSGQVLTLFTRTNDTRVHLRTSHFVYDYFVDAFDKRLADIDIQEQRQNNKFFNSLQKNGIIFSPPDKQALFERSNLIPNLLAEQYNQERGIL